MQPPIGVVLIAEAILEGDRRCAFGKLGEYRERSGFIVGVYKVQVGRGQQLVKGPAQHDCPRGVQALEIPILVGDAEQVEGGGEEQGKLALGLFHPSGQRALGLHFPAQDSRISRDLSPILALAFRRHCRASLGGASNWAFPLRRVKG